VLVRVRTAPGVIRRVDVCCATCPTFGCFWIARHVVRSPAGASGASSRSTDQYECGRREQRGCPESPVPSNPPGYRRGDGVWRPIEGAVRQ